MKDPLKFRLAVLLPIAAAFSVVIFSAALAGSDDYEKDLLTPEFHEGRREALRQLMPDSTVAVFFANPIRKRANDVNYDYHQDPNFYYLTGLLEPNAMLIVFKEKQKIDTLFTDEILFVQDRDPQREAWTGRRLGKEGAAQKLKLHAALTGKSFVSLNINWKKYRKVFYFSMDEVVADDVNDVADLADLKRGFRRQTDENKNNETGLLASYMAMLRQVKLPEEMVLLRKAITISNEAHIELMKALEPDMSEYHAQAIIEYEFRVRGAEACGYPSICGAGENSCILHYVTNRKPMEKNNLIVVDAGAEYHGYTADITRTLPANGKFSPEQKTIYDIVLEAQLAGIAECKNGNEFRAPHKAAVKIIKKRLLELGIIKKEEEFTQYFFHGTSHYLGLDVHDAGLFGHLQPGNVITVEPGIYIPEGSPCDPKWWNIGIRIEDDVLITAGAPEVLSGIVPKTTEEIEKTMAEGSYLNSKKNTE
ncbi:MAG TPA: aminopeptidase P N-terminal domain-containing protein [Bacteroidia bacterium]|nr:aminopeptidase P N-terminal domain-containing protein [Bacteroidia bacterium]